METKKGKYIIAGALVIIVLGFLGMLLPRLTPLRICFERRGGKTSDEALVRFADKVITATLDEDFSWLKTVSDEEPFNILSEYQEYYPFIEDGYFFGGSDDFDGLDGLYEIIVFFPEQSLRLTVESHWPICPDFNVTEEEIDQNIRLIKVKQNEPIE